MMSSLFRLLTFLLFLSTVGTAAGLGSVLSKGYEQLHFGSTWRNAQNFCRKHYNDLATIYNQADANNVSWKEYNAWIDQCRQTSGNNGNAPNNNNMYGNKCASANPDENGNCAAIGYRSDSDRRIYRRKCEDYLFPTCQINSGNRIIIIKEMKTWSQAEAYCKGHNDSLATLEHWQTIHFHEQDLPIWIGLHRNGGSWKWSLGLMEDKHWNLSEASDDNTCVTIYSKSKKLATKNCQTKLPFLCIKDNMVLVKENKSWEEALEHCRGLRLNANLHYNLLSVQPGSEHSYVVNKVMEADTEEVWTGLHFLGDEWLWINGADMLYTDLLQCPVLGQRCGALSKNDAGTVEARDCLERKNFLCYSYQPE